MLEISRRKKCQGTGDRGVAAYLGLMVQIPSSDSEIPGIFGSLGE